MTRRRRRRGLLFLLPLLVVNAAVLLVPGVESIYYSVTDWRGVGAAHFVGLDNYTRMWRDPEVRSAFAHNVWWLLYFLIVPMAMGLLGAFLLSRVRRGRQLFRIAYFLPYVLASVITAQVWTNLLDPEHGLGSILDVNFLGQASTALPTIAVINNWSWWGFLVLIFLAAMQGVNPSLYEAAQLDGASAWRQFWHVTLPAIRPTFMFLALMTIVWSFLAFDFVYILTQGGPAGASDVLATVLYRQAFGAGDVGYASALGVLLAAMSAVVVTTHMYLRRRFDWEI
jgi:raffinose/stachyose/melibiose transport system permease protein